MGNDLNKRSVVFGADAVDAGRVRAAAAPFAIACALVGFMGFAGNAQANDPVTTINTEFGRNVSPTGLRMHSLTVFPTVTSGFIYDDNILDREVNVEDDFVYFIAPSVTLVKKSLRSETELEFSALVVDYFEESENDYADVGGVLTHNYFWRPDLKLITNLSLQHANERRTSTDQDLPTDSAEPTERLSLLSSVGVELDRKYWDASLTFSYTNDDYDDVRTLAGDIADQDFRDSEEYSVTKVVNIELSRKITANVTTAIRTENVRSSPFIIDRDATRYEVDGSVTVQLTPRIAATVGAGLLKEDFHERTVIDADALPSYRASVLWKPSDRFTLQVSLETAEEGVDFSVGGAAGETNSVDVLVEYFLNRNLKITGNYNFESSDFTTDNFTIDTTNASLNAHYALSRYSGISLSYFYVKRDSSRLFDSYERNVWQASVKAQF